MTNNDLIQKIDNFESTIPKRLRIAGEVKEYTAYKIPLEELKYNIKNDRIATFIEQYIDEHGDFPSEKDEVNDLLENFIVSSNPDAFQKTKSSIKAIGQHEIAVVLSNGIVIDGNRRFTALRKLYKEDNENDDYKYLEAVIIDADKITPKDIKRLELNLQHGIEGKVDYNPIERLVGIYRDLIVEGHPFELEEYAEETQTDVGKVKQEVAIAHLMVEYLEYIKEPFKFHIARAQKIDGPLREVYKILKSQKIDKEKKEEVKQLLFANLLSLDGDVTRKIRALKPVLEDEKLSEEMIQDSADTLDDLSDNLDEKKYDVQHDKSDDEEVPKDNTNIPMKVSENDIVYVEPIIKEHIVETTERYITRQKLTIAKNQPIAAIKNAIARLDDIDLDQVARMDESYLLEFRSYIDDIQYKIDKLKNQ